FYFAAFIIIAWRLAVLVVLTPDFRSGAARIGLGVRWLKIPKILLGAAKLLMARLHNASRYILKV
ncbi:MAG TPA: hypothetical protein VIH48_01935, partial [Candidatus Bathyarchaeia archaeon]